MKEKLKEKASDLLIVIVGITIAFALSSWYEGYKNSKIENFYKESILIDLKNDKKQLENLSQLLKQHEQGAFLLIKSLQKETQNDDSLFIYLNSFNRLYQFQPLTHNYAAFSTHTAQTTKKLSLKMKLDFLFIRQYSSLNSVEGFYQNRLNSHYFPKKEIIVSSSERSIKNRDLLNSYIFKDIAESLPSYINQEKNVLDRTIQHIDELIILLEN